MKNISNHWLRRVFHQNYSPEVAEKAIMQENKSSQKEYFKQINEYSLKYRI